VVADRELEAHPRIDEGSERTPERRVEAVPKVAVIADVAQQGDQTVRRRLVGDGHALGDCQRLAATAAVVAQRHERQAVVRCLPGMRPELHVRRLAREEVLACQQRPHRTSQSAGRRRGSDQPHPCSQKLTPIHHHHILQPTPQRASVTSSPAELAPARTDNVWWIVSSTHHKTWPPASSSPRKLAPQS
jgi:hypothetical protein